MIDEAAIGERFGLLRDQGQSAASNATSRDASGTCSSRPTRSKEHRHHHQFLDIGAAKAVARATITRAIASHETPGARRIDHRATAHALEAVERVDPRR